jgi:hypothetical protein
MLLPDEVPAAAERALLVAKLVAMGYLGTDLAAIIVADRTRREMADNLIALQKGANKPS